MKKVRTKWLVVALAAFWATDVLAACKILPLGEAPGEFLKAYDGRLHVTGAGGSFLVGPVNEKRDLVMYQSLSSGISVALRASDNMLFEVRGALAGPANDADIERLKIAIAFGLSHYGDINERAAKEVVTQSFKRAQSEKTVTAKAGSATLVLQQPEPGSWTYSVGKLECS